MNYKIVIFIILTIVFTACSQPQNIVAKRYDQEKEDREIKTIFQNELSSLVYAIGEDENCTYVDKYLFVKMPPENDWKIMREEGSKDCDKQEDAETKNKYEQWKADQAHNLKYWRPGMPL
jgi:hypothetical protein